MRRLVRRSRLERNGSFEIGRKRNAYKPSPGLNLFLDSSTTPHTSLQLSHSQPFAIMDFLKNMAQQASASQGSQDNQQQHNQQSGSNNNEQLAGMMGALNNTLGQQNKEGNPAPASNDQISGLMGTLGKAMGDGNQNKEGGSQVSGLMGQLQNTLGQTQQQANKQGTQQNDQVGGLMGMINGAMGGGSQGEAKEDKLDKAIDMFQEKVMKAGDQSNESAAEQMKDKQIAGAIRSGYKSATGKDFPV